MRLVIARRAIAAAAAITLLTIPSAFAESVAADFDIITAGSQDTRDLGTVQPGADVPLDLYFTLTCSGTNHVNPTQVVRLSPAIRIAPTGGGYSVGTLNFGLGAGWPIDGQQCPTGLAPTIGGPLHIIVTAPDAPGDDYRYYFSWNRAVVPASLNDVGVFEGTNPSITIYLDVPGGTANTPPTLNLPADSVVEGNTTGGATAAYVVTASDVEDAVAPTPSCSPAVGSLLPLGENTITCSATDSGGMTTTGSFKITVLDRTAPTLSGMPGDVSLTTADPAGATLTYAPPTASDIVDPSPSVSCSHASGSIIPVGDTTVNCTAVDDSGNSSSDSFAAHVTLAQAIWEDPVGASAGIVVNGSRTVPVKVQLLLGGQPVASGDGMLTVTPCDGGAPVVTTDLDVQSNGRWMGHLDTSGLTAGCYRVTASVDGQVIGSFQLTVKADSGSLAKPAKAKTKP